MYPIKTSGPPFQFRLLWLFIGCTVACVLVAIKACEIRAKSEADAARIYFEKIGTFYLDKVGDALILEGTDITDDKLRQIGKLTKLRAIILRRTSISDEGLEQLQKCTELAYVDLRNTNVSNEGVRRLQQRLPECSIEWAPQK